MPRKPFSTLTTDQRRLLGALRQEQVAFVVIGGYAVRAHGCVRRTEDLDLLVDRSAVNVARVGRALTGVNAAKVDEAVALLARSQKAQIKWSDSELFAAASQFTYQDAVSEAVEVSLDDEPLLVMSASQLIQAKRHSAALPKRGAKGAQDLKDLKCLTKKMESV